MDSVLWKQFGLILAVALCACAAGLHAQSMPNVTPVASVPQGLGNGGGVVTRVTYEMRLAANDAAVASAANEARYVTRAVTVGRGTIGRMVLGASSRLFWPLAAATAAYAAYEWYKDANGVLTQPGSTTPGASCVAGGSYFGSAGTFGGSGCSVPGAMAQFRQNLLTQWAYMQPRDLRLDGCVPSVVNTTCQSTGTFVDGRTGATTEVNTSIHWYQSGSTVTQDPDVVTQPSPVTDDQLGQIAESHPDWWPQVLTDPQTGNPVITPEIADDMNALRHQIAPDYGVDPQTLPDVQPDPEYLDGKAVPREQSIPEFCQWASAACNYFKFAEDNWPDKQGDKHVVDSADCVAPPSCSGDEVMCAVVRNTWAGKCATAGDPSVTRPVFGEHKVAELDQPDVDVGDTSQLDQAGFGWGGACPFTDLGIDFGGQHVGVSVAAVCEYGPWMRAFILILAGLKCAEIMAGLRVAAE